MTKREDEPITDDELARLRGRWFPDSWRVARLIARIDKEMAKTLEVRKWLLEAGRAAGCVLPDDAGDVQLAGALECEERDAASAQANRDAVEGTLREILEAADRAWPGFQDSKQGPPGAKLGSNAVVHLIDTLADQVRKAEKRVVKQEDLMRRIRAALGVLPTDPVVDVVKGLVAKDKQREAERAGLEEILRPRPTETLEDAARRLADAAAKPDPSPEGEEPQAVVDARTELFMAAREALTVAGSPLLDADRDADRLEQAVYALARVAMDKEMAEMRARLASQGDVRKQTEEES